MKLAIAIAASSALLLAVPVTAQAYVGTVRVLGDDHFDLDRDGDGIACDT